MEHTRFVGLDIHKERISIAVAESGRAGAVEYLGEVVNDPGAISKLCDRLGRPGRPLAFCYEAGPCGYGVYRQLLSLGHRCNVVAPSLIPMKPGDRVKTDRRDATMLARLHRAGELTPVWVPDADHEAMRDLIRLRSVVRQIVTRTRQHLQGFLLRHGRKHGQGTAWRMAYRRWLSTLAFQHPAQQIAFQDYVDRGEGVQEKDDPRHRRQLKLAQYAIAVENHCSQRSGGPTPMDVECAKYGGDGELYIIQARPETVAARRKPEALESYALKSPGKAVATGRAVGERIATGKVRLITKKRDLRAFKPGEVLVAPATSPDWEPVMKIATAIITDHGGRTCCESARETVSSVSSR
jgi:hypothetical protein